MNIRFSVEYRTEYGQELMLHLSEAGSGGLKTAVEYRMHTENGQTWHCDIQKDWPLGTVLSYYYSVERGGATERQEWLVVPHRLELTAGGTSYRVYDHWSDLPEDSFLYSSAVSDCLMEARLSVPPCDPLCADRPPQGACSPAPQTLCRRPAARPGPMEDGSCRPHDRACRGRVDGRYRRGTPLWQPDGTEVCCRGRQRLQQERLGVGRQPYRHVAPDERWRGGGL